jgi:hypothetical protein
MNGIKQALKRTLLMFLLINFGWLCISLSVPLVSAQGDNYYVDSQIGDDSNTGMSEASPFKTIQRALDLSGPGDTVLVKDGNYFDRWGLNFSQSGEPNNVITIKAFPGHRPRVESPWWCTFCINDRSYIHIEGFDITNTTPNPDPKDGAGDGILISNNSHHITIMNNRVFDAGGGGIASVHADYLTIVGNTIHGNTARSNYGHSGISIYQPFNSDNSVTGYRNVIRGNKIYNNINLRPFRHSSTNQITDGNGIIVDDSKQTQNFNNNPYLNQPYLGRTLIENNIIFNNGGRAIHVFLSERVDVFNNTSLLNNLTDIINGELSANNSSDVVFRNNIAYAQNNKRGSVSSNSTQVSFDSNLYFNTTTFVEGTDDLVTDPLFVNSSTDPNNINLRLTEQSPAIDSGSSTVSTSTDFVGTTRPQGARIDRGAFEYIPTLLDNQNTTQEPENSVNTPNLITPETQNQTPANNNTALVRSGGYDIKSLLKIFSVICLTLFGITYSKTT